MFYISMFKDALEKTNVLALPIPKNVSFEGKNWNRSLVISCLSKKLERENGGQIPGKIP